MTKDILTWWYLYCYDCEKHFDIKHSENGGRRKCPKCRRPHAYWFRKNIEKPGLLYAVDAAVSQQGAAGIEEGEREY